MTTPTMQDSQTDLVRSRLLTMRRIHLALVGGVAMFGFVVFIVTRGKMSFSPALNLPIVIVSIVAAATAVLSATLLHKVYFRASPAPADAQGAVQRYQTFFLMRAAMIEGGALFSAVATLISSNIVPAGMFVLCAVALAVNRPTEREFISTTGTTQRE